MSTENKNRAVTIVIALFFLFFFLTCMLKPAKEFSDSERRKLAQVPEMTGESILSGKFMQKFEDYTLDQFPFRDRFRNVKALFVTEAARQKDNNGMYEKDGYISQMEYPLDKDAVTYAGERFSYIYDKYLEKSNGKIYVSVIPDKNYFMAEKSGHLCMDYPKLIEILRGKMEFATYIDITKKLSLEDYYRTDTHWRQECITEVAETLLKAMGGDEMKTVDYEEHTLDKPFYGVYYGQAALPVQPEKIKYLTWKELSGCRVYDYENNREMEVYDFEKGKGKDSYELFLSGSLSLITIENPNADTEKELVVFRDSFASSLAPLLTTGYRKITLADIRYLHPDMLERFISFENQDVLFLYSTIVLNNSETIK